MSVRTKARRPTGAVEIVHTNYPHETKNKLPKCDKITRVLLTAFQQNIMIQINIIYVDAWVALMACWTVVSCKVASRELDWNVFVSKLKTVTSVEATLLLRFRLSDYNNSITIYYHSKFPLVLLLTMHGC